jgi:hypothetical protein
MRPGTSDRPGDTPMGRPPRRGAIEIGVPKSACASANSMRSAREQYSGFVAFVPSKAFINRIASRRGHLRGACFVAFFLLAATSTGHVNFPSHFDHFLCKVAEALTRSFRMAIAVDSHGSRVSSRGEVCSKSLIPAKRTLYSPLELHFRPHCESVINHVPGPNSRSASSPNESRVHWRSRALYERATSIRARWKDWYLGVNQTANIQCESPLPVNR